MNRTHSLFILEEGWDEVLQACKPVSVSPSVALAQAGFSIIYLRSPLLATCICLPWIIGRAALN